MLNSAISENGGTVGSFQWAEWRTRLPTLEEHSKAKLEVLRDYIERYIEILCKNTFGQTEFKLTLVDGFAGGGMYAGDLLGSPFVLLKAVQVAEARLNEYRTKGFAIDCHYYFVDEDPDALDCLEHHLRQRGYGNEIGKSIFLIRDTFQNAHTRIVVESKTRYTRDGSRVIFFLDQFGYSDVPAALVRSISHELNQKAEFILNFAIDWFTAFVGDNKAFTGVYPKLGLSEVLPIEELLEARKNSQFHWQYIVEAKIGPAFQAVAGAKFFSPFYIQAPKSNRGYWLVHLAPQRRAREAMIDTYWRSANGCLHFGHAGIDMLTYKPEANPTGYLQGMEFSNATRATVQTRLLDDFARVIRDDHSPGVTYDDFLARHSNRTMASEEIIQETIGELMQRGEVDVSGAKGGAKRCSKISKMDVLRPGQCKMLLHVPQVFRTTKRRNKKPANATDEIA